MVFKSISKHTPLSPEEEEYFHLVDCIESFRRSIEILRELSNANIGRTLTDAAHKMAIIEYAKPYTSARGNSKFKYCLETPALCTSDTRLHDVLLTLRDKVIAHSDLTPKQGKVFSTSATESRPAIVSLNTDPQMPSVDRVLALVERTLELHQERRLQMSSSMFPNLE